MRPSQLHEIPTAYARPVAAGLLLAATLGAGCYAHQASHAPAVVANAGLPAPRAGSYRLSSEQQQVGTERLSVTSTSAWTLRGRVTWTDPLPARARYRLELVDDQPHRLDIRFELMGRARVVRAEVRDGYLHVRARGLGPAFERKVPYAPGTAIDALSPAVRVWTLGLLTRRLLPGASIDVRTVRFDGPAFAPVVELQTLEVEAAQGDLRLVRVRRPDGHPPEALWVRPDGFVVRARSWPRGLGAPFVERTWAEAGR